MITLRGEPLDVPRRAGLRRTTRRPVGSRRMREAVSRPLPDVAGHVAETDPFRREPLGRRALVPVGEQVLPGELALPRRPGRRRRAQEAIEVKMPPNRCRRRSRRISRGLPGLVGRSTQRACEGRRVSIAASTSDVHSSKSLCSPSRRSPSVRSGLSCDGNSGSIDATPVGEASHWRGRDSDDD